MVTTHHACMLSVNHNNLKNSHNLHFGAYTLRLFNSYKFATFITIPHLLHLPADGDYSFPTLLDRCGFQYSGTFQRNHATLICWKYSHLNKRVSVSWNDIPWIVICLEKDKIRSLSRHKLLLAHQHCGYCLW